MAITIDEVGRLLEALDLRFQKRDDRHILFGMRLENYRDPDGDDGLRLVIELSEDGEYFQLFAPQAFKAIGPHVEAFLRACTMIQWRTKLIQFEYDASDGEIRPIIEFPVEDGTLTRKQLSRCINGICQLMDQFYMPLKRALDEGVVELPGRGEAVGTMLTDMLRDALGPLTPEAREALLRRLTEPPAASAPVGAPAPAAGGTAQAGTAPSVPPPGGPPTEL